MPLPTNALSAQRRAVRPQATTEQPPSAVVALVSYITWPKLDKADSGAKNSGVVARAAVYRRRHNNHLEVAVVTTTYVCQATDLEGFVARVMKALGTDEDVAAEVTRHLVRANLSGHDSHGVQQIPNYASQAENGRLVPSARPSIARETAVAALIDAQRCFGHYSTAFALDWAMNRAREHGVATVAIRHSTHIGRVGEYSERAAEQGLIAIIALGAGGPNVGAMLLPGSIGRFFGTNPWSVGVPIAGYPPLIFDGATSMMAEGKVRVAHAKGIPVPPGCIVDAEGKMTTNPADFVDGGALLPLGGEAAGHKGYGLAFAAMALGGLGMIDDPSPTMIGAMLPGGTPKEGVMAGVFLCVIDPACFGDADHYKQQMAEMVRQAKGMPLAPGVDEIVIPGEPEVRTRERRSAEGIAIPEPTWLDLEKVAQQLSVPLPRQIAI